VLCECSQAASITGQQVKTRANKSAFSHYKGSEKANGEVAKYDYIHVPDNIGTIVAIGGTGGGFYGPAYIYDDLARHVADYKLSLLRIHVSPPYDKGVKQVLTGLNVLKTHNNMKPILLMGWSMGGATIINVAKELIERNDELKVKCLVSFAGQTAGARPISDIDTRIHVIHGDNDKCLNVKCAYTISSWARNLGDLVILKGASHWMEECFAELREAVYSIITHEFKII